MGQQTKKKIYDNYESKVCQEAIATPGKQIAGSYCRKKVNSLAVKKLAIA